jgi:hypothetical protein
MCLESGFGETRMDLEYVAGVILESVGSFGSG